MSTSVDNRVVRMTFDNAQFERGIKSTKSLLEEFEKKLKMDGASTGFDKIKEAADKLNLNGLSDKVKSEVSKIAKLSSDASTAILEIDKAAEKADFSPLSSSAQDAIHDVNVAASNVDLTPISNSADQAANGFNNLETIAVGALLNIGNKVAEAGLNIANNIKNSLFGPITQGFEEYQTQIGSIQTIMANTGMDFHSSDDIALVNDRLDTLNEYADKTIYNFTEMTRNIGTFTAAGIDLDTSVDAIQGIANVAALSGSNSEQASRAMYQLSQALAAGRVKLMDWNSVVNAGMGGKVLQDALIRTARAHGVAIDQILEDTGSFRDSLEMEWIDNDVLLDTLNQFSISFHNAAEREQEFQKLLEQGYSEDEANEILRLAKAAEESATQVRTWSQLWDTFGESVGSNWALVWRGFIGDFQQATDTFSYLSRELSKGVDNLFGGIVNAASLFSANLEDQFGNKLKSPYEIIFGGYAKDEEGNTVADPITGEFIRVEGAIDHLMHAIEKPLQAIGDAFDSVFGMDDGTILATMASFAYSFDNFSKSLIISDDAQIGIKQIFEGLFSVLDIGITIVIDAAGAFGQLLDIVRCITDPLTDIALALGGQVGKVLLWIHDRFLDIRAAAFEAARPLGNAIQLVKDIVRAFFGIADIPNAIQAGGDSVLDFLDSLWNFAGIPDIIKGIGAALEAVFGTVAEMTGWNAAVEEAAQLSAELGKEVSAVDVFVGHLMETPVVKFFKDIADSVVQFAGELKDSIASLVGLNEEGKKAELPQIFANIASVARTALSVLQFIGLIIGGTIYVGAKAVYKIASAIWRLLQSIAGFVGRVKDFILAWGPIKDIVDKLKAFKDTLGGFLTNMPERLDNASKTISNPLDVIKNAFNGFIGEIDKLTEYFSNLTPEQAIEDIRNWFNGILQSIRDVFSYFKHTSPEDMVQDFITGLKQGVWKIYYTLKSMIPTLDALFPGIGESVEKGLFNATSVIQRGITGIKDFILPVAQESKNIPEFISNLFTKIRDTISGKITDIITTIQSITPKDVQTEISTFLVGPFYGAAKKLEETFPALKGIVTRKTAEFINAFTQVFSSLLRDEDGNDISDDWNKVFANIAKKLSDAVVGLPQTLLDLVSPITGAIGDAFKWLIDLLAKIPGPIGEFFGWFSGVLSGLKGPIDVAVGALNGLLDMFKRFIFGDKQDQENQEDPFAGIKNAFVNFKETGLVGIIDEVKKLFTGQFDSVSDWILSIAQKIIDLCTKFADMIDQSGVITRVVELIKQVLIGRLLWSLNDLVKGLGNLAKGIGKKLKKESVDNIGDTFLKVGGAFAIVAGALWVISTIDNVWECVAVMGAMEVLLLGLQAVSGLIMKHFGPGIGTQLISAAGSIGIFAVSLLAMMFTIEKLTAFDIGANIKGLGLTLGAITVLGLIASTMCRIAGDGGGELIKASVGIMILIGAVNLLIPTIQNITNMVSGINPDMYGIIVGALFAVAGFVAAMGGALRLVGDHGASAGVGFILLAVSINMIVAAITPLLSVPLEQLGAGFGAVVAILGEFGIMVGKLDPKKMTKAAISLVLYSGAVGAIAYALYQLSGMDALAVAAAGIAISAIIQEFTGIGKAIDPKKAAKLAMALVLYSGAVGAIAFSLYQLGDLDAGAMAAAGLAISAIVQEFTGLGKTVDPKNASKVALGLVLYSGAVGVIALALYELAECDGATLAAAGFAITEVVAGMALLSKMNKGGGNAAAVGAALMIYSVGIVVISQALKQLSDCDPETLLQASGAIDVVVGGMVALQNLNKGGGNAAAVGAALMIYSIGIVIISQALKQLADCDPDTMLQASGAIDAVVGGMIALQNLNKGGGNAAAVGAALMIYSIGIVIISQALQQLADCDPDTILKASGAIDVVVAGMIALQNLNKGGANAAAVGAALMIYSGGIMVIALALKQLEECNPDTLVTAGVVIGALAGSLALLGLAGPELVIAAVAVDLFAAALLGIAFALEKMEDVVNNVPSAEQFTTFGYNITAGLGKGIADGTASAVESMLDAARRIIEAIKNFFGIQSPSTVMQDEVGGNIMAGLGEGLMGGEGDVNNIFQTILDGIMLKLQEFVNGLPAWFETTGLPMLQQFLANIWTWFTTDGIPMIQQGLTDFWNWFTTDGIRMLGEFGIGILNKLGELATQFWEWFTTDGMPMIGQALADFWNWATTEGLPKLGEFIMGILGKLGELAGQFWNWLSTDGIKMLGDAASTFWNWVQTEGLPKLGEFITGLFSKIGEIPGMIGKWVMDEGLPAIGRALDDLMKKAGELGGMLLDWVKGLPDNISKGLSDIWNTIKDIGDDIARGISEGIDRGVDWILNSVRSMGDSAFNAIKNFFGIASPSKLMKDEVGRYIPEGVGAGITQYSKVAERAAEEMAKATANSAQEGLNSNGPISLESSVSSPNLTGMQASVTPVFDMNAFEGQLNTLRNDVTASQSDLKLTMNDTVTLKSDELSTSITDACNRLYDLINNDVGLRLASLHWDSVSMMNIQTGLLERFNNDSNLMQRLAYIRDDVFEIRSKVVNIENTLDYMDGTFNDIQSFTLETAQNTRGGNSIYMDTGALVGAIAPEMDNQLGLREIMSSRGAM